MRDPRLDALVAGRLHSCGGSCALSRNEHIHFPEGFGSFLEKVTSVLAEPVEVIPAVDPTDDLAARWQSAFAVVWPELKAAATSGDAALVKAAELALEMARARSPIR